MNDNMRSLVKGLLAGLVGQPVGWPEQKEPVACRYKLGLLCCRAIKFPSSYPHTSTWDVGPQWVGYYHGSRIWTDGTNIYHSYYDNQYVLNGDTWEVKTWNVDRLVASYIWTDGTNIYYSDHNSQYVLNGDTWAVKAWGNKPSYFYGNNVWSDGTHIFYSHQSLQYVLNGDTWEIKTWNGLTNFIGNDIWSDGAHIYYSNYDAQYVLNGDTWEVKTWSSDGNKFVEAPAVGGIWTDGVKIYFSDVLQADDYTAYYIHYVLNGDTWEVKTWNGLTDFSGSDVWSDGTKLYIQESTGVYTLV